MIRLVPVALLLAIELLIFYQVDPAFAYPFRGLIHLYIAYWYYSAKKSVLTLTDRLFIVSCLIPAFTPIPIFLFGFTWGTLVEVVLLLVSYQLLIKIYRLEGARIKLTNNLRTFIRVLVPFVLFPLVYFVISIFNIHRYDVVLILSVYLLQIMYMAVLSAYLPFEEKSKLSITMGMFFIIFASGTSFHRVYITPFEFDYGIVRIAANLGRILLVTGLLNRAYRKPVIRRRN